MKRKEAINELIKEKYKEYVIDTNWIGSYEFFSGLFDLNSGLRSNLVSNGNAITEITFENIEEIDNIQRNYIKLYDKEINEKYEVLKEHEKFNQILEAHSDENLLNFLMQENKILDIFCCDGYKNFSSFIIDKIAGQGTSEKMLEKARKLREDRIIENTQKRLDFLIEKANFKFDVFVKVYFFNCHFYCKLSFELKSSDNGTELNLLNDKVSSINSFSGVGEFIFDLVDDDFNPLPIKAKNKKQYRENINKLRFLEDEKFKEFINNVDKYILNKKLNEKLNTKEVKVKKIKI